MLRETIAWVAGLAGMSWPRFLFWNAVGGQYKASLDFVTTIACESGSAFERGPEVRTQTIAVRHADGPRCQSGGRQWKCRNG